MKGCLSLRCMSEVANQNTEDDNRRDEVAGQRRENISGMMKLCKIDGAGWALLIGADRSFMMFGEQKTVA